MVFPHDFCVPKALQIACPHTTIRVMLNETKPGRSDRQSWVICASLESFGDVMEPGSWDSHCRLLVGASHHGKRQGHPRSQGLSEIAPGMPAAFTGWRCLPQPLGEEKMTGFGLELKGRRKTLGCAAQPLGGMEGGLRAGWTNTN